MKVTEQKFIKFIKDNNLLDESNRLLIALSGGPDSVFALSIFSKFTKMFNSELFAIHINHNLRGNDSDKDEEFCRELCNSLNIKLDVYSENVKKFAKSEKKSIEEAARIIRYKSYKISAEKFRCNRVVTAHNKNDNTETVLLNLFKGSGIKGLSGIPIIRENIIRPLLCLTKDEIISYLNNKNQKFRIDKTNYESDYTRNFLRNDILPLIQDKINNKVDDAVFNSSYLLKIYDNWTDELSKDWFDNNCSFADGCLHVQITENEDNSFLINLKSVLKNLFNFNASFNDYAKFKGLLSKQKGTSEQLGDDLIAFKEHSEIVIFRQSKNSNEIHNISEGMPLKVGTININVKFTSDNNENYHSNSGVEIIDASNIRQLSVRKWKAGDRFIPLGMNREKTVSDFLTDEKVPAYLKRNKLVLLNDEEIIWVVGHRINEKYKITNKTNKYCKLWIN